MRLINKKTGKIVRRKNWRSRYKNLNERYHNNLRITRILTSLGHLGFTKYKKSWVKFLTKEIEVNGELPACSAPLKKYWQPTLEVDSKAFAEKTGETASDREPSIFFRIMEENDWLDESPQELTDEELELHNITKEKKRKRKSNEIEEN